MFNKILIVGCGLIGSSILRASIKKKISKKIYILEKSKNHIKQIKKLRLKCEFIKIPKIQIPSVDMIIFCTHLGEYIETFKKIEKYISKNTIVTDVVSSKEKIFFIVYFMYLNQSFVAILIFLGVQTGAFFQ